MKDISEFRMNVKDNEDIKTLAMDIMQFFFSKTQENLVRPMAWGDDEYPSNRKPSVISDQGAGGVLGSGVPPYWEDNKTIVFRYDAPHAKWIEWGTPPHPVAAKHLVGWVNRRIGVRGKKATRIAYAVATKIKKEGVDPHPFVRPAGVETRNYFGFIPLNIGVR